MLLTNVFWRWRLATGLQELADTRLVRRFRRYPDELIVMYIFLPWLYLVRPEEEFNNNILMTLGTFTVNPNHWDTDDEEWF